MRGGGPHCNVDAPEHARSITMVPDGLKGPFLLARFWIACCAVASVAVPHATGVNQPAWAPIDGQPLPPYEPGAHIDLHLPNGLIRQYSLIRAEPDPSCYAVTVKPGPREPRRLALRARRAARRQGAQDQRAAQQFPSGREPARSCSWPAASALPRFGAWCSGCTSSAAPGNSTMPAARAPTRAECGPRRPPDYSCD
jgi:hypothetical protein